MDESHVTLPQVRGMFAGDRARKEMLVNYGFRLPSAFDNRPLNFDEFYSHINQAVFVSATPGDLELSLINISPGTDVRVVALGQLLDELLRPGLAGGLPHLLEGGAGPAICPPAQAPFYIY